jgi:L-alanine-DL-glutamate epimerase-like enolase superfamily enzyme
VKINRVETFQVQWSPDDEATRRSAFVRIFVDEGLVGIGEASPMQGGAASLGIIERYIGPR